MYAGAETVLYVHAQRVSTRRNSAGPLAQEEIVLQCGNKKTLRSSPRASRVSYHGDTDRDCDEEEQSHLPLS